MAVNEDSLKKPLYVFDLPQEILNSLQYKPNENSLEAEDEIAKASLSENGTTGLLEDSAVTKTACALCGLTFTGFQEQRSHVRSDLHGYNVKQRMRGLNPVSEAVFEKLIGDLDESISGSETSESESDSGEIAKEASDGSILSALLKKQANIRQREEEEDEGISTRKRKKGAGKPPLVWFKSTILPADTSLGVYRVLFSADEQSNEDGLVASLKKKQLGPGHILKKGTDDEDGGVKLPNSYIGPHYFLCMIGGGHFAAMVVSLTPKTSKSHGSDERQASVLAHKTFHRYTTRRKQGGSQAANDSAKGAAHSAGSSLRRYNEAALTTEVRALLFGWKEMIDTSELLLIRATGSTNRRTLFGPYDGQVLRQDDPRVHGFPFSTRRATQAELMRCFIELTRVKVSQIDEAALAASQEKMKAEADMKASTPKAKSAPHRKAKTEKSPEEEAALLHTSQIEAIIRRSRASALLSYLTSNSLSPDFRFYPPDSQSHHHTPTPLHLASSLNSPALVSMLLVKVDANPTIENAEGKTAFDIAGDRATRDAFRLARHELGEGKWNWDNGAHVPEGLSKSQVEKRNEREKAENDAKEEARRKAELEKLRADERRKEQEREKNADDRREKKMGKGKSLMSEGKPVTAEEKREEESRGMTPEMKMRLERERRARAAEERMRKMAGGGS